MLKLKRTIEETHMIQNLIVSRINFDMLDRSELIVGVEISPICHLSQRPTHMMKNLDHRRVCPTKKKNGGPKIALLKEKHCPHEKKLK